MKKNETHNNIALSDIRVSEGRLGVSDCFLASIRTRDNKVYTFPEQFRVHCRNATTMLSHYYVHTVEFWDISTCRMSTILQQ